MRYPAPEKVDIIQLVEQSHRPAKRILDTLGIPRVTFYRWYHRYRSGGPEALADKVPTIQAGLPLSRRQLMCALGRGICCFFVFPFGQHRSSPAL